MADLQYGANESPTGTDSDQDFDPSAEMMVNDFDDEHTLDEEEALDEAEDELATKNEIDDLTKVSSHRTHSPMTNLSKPSSLV